MELVLAIVFLVLFTWGIIELILWGNRKQAEYSRKTYEWIAKVPHTQNILSPNHLMVLLINELTNIFYFADRSSVKDVFDIEVIPFDNILEVAVVEDEQIVYSYPQNGLLSSEMSSKSDEDEDEKVSDLSLKILIDDLTNPIVEFVLIESNHSTDSDEYNIAFQQCSEWFQKVSIIIKRNEHSKVLVKKWR